MLVARLREGAEDFEERLGADDRELRLDVEEFESRLGADDRTRDVERDGAESRLLDERLRLGADSRLGADELRPMLAPRDGAEERVLREGVERRSRLLLERTVRPLRTDADERFSSDRLVRLPFERPDSRLLELLEIPVERSLPRDRLVVEVREPELPRNDSLMRLERSADERVDSVERLREAARSGALPLTVRLRELSRLDPVRVEADRLEEPRLRLSARDAPDARRSPPRRSATRSDREVEFERERVRALSLIFMLDRRSAAHSRRSDRTDARPAREELTRADAGRLLSTNRVCSTRPR